MNFITLFIILNIANVILQTVKSICTVKCGKEVAALVNAIAYGLYTYVIFYTSAEGLLTWQKALITALANLIGVYAVKWIEEKSRTDKLWKVEFTVNKLYLSNIDDLLEENDIPHSYIEIGKNVIFNSYCQTQHETAKVAEIVKVYNGKYFISENKGVL